MARFNSNFPLSLVTAIGTLGGVVAAHAQPALEIPCEDYATVPEKACRGALSCATDRCIALGGQPVPGPSAPILLPHGPVIQIKPPPPAGIPTIYTCIWSVGCVFPRDVSSDDIKVPTPGGF